jgi:hypothetical protein
MRMTDVKRQAYQEKAEAKIEEQVAELDKLKAKAKGQVADAKLEVAGLVEQAEQRLSEMRERLGKVGDAGEDAWEDLVKGVDDAWDDVTGAVQSAWKRLRA